ncbi:MAG TPA: hypothetical protein VI876_08035 [Dehalococcoidia bacterium]|nr:hypothetical protein [Dehalococcoidia bacterium]
MPEYEPADRYFESSRLKLHYVIWGGESKPPMVLRHAPCILCRATAQTFR